MLWCSITVQSFRALSSLSFAASKVMAGLCKYFKRKSLPKSNETGLGETVTKEANAAVERVMEAATTSNTANAATGRKRKYTHFTPEQRAKIARYAVQMWQHGSHQTL